LSSKNKNTLNGSKEDSFMVLLKGSDLASRIEEEISREIDQNDIQPKLVAVLMSEDSASQTYVNLKKEACERVGIESDIVKIDPDKDEEVLISKLEKLNQDDSVDGILVQLPLPKQVSEQKVFRKISPEKDVDGFNPLNVGRLVQNDPRFVPATPKAVKRILKEYGYSFSGKHVVIVNRSNVVGKPLANMLVQNNPDDNATVTICHINTENLEEHTKRADILVTAVGKPGLITSEMVKENSVVIDVGIKRIEDEEGNLKELRGDVSFEGVKDKVESITPVPGGVGPMTVSMLLENTLEAAKMRQDMNGE
jgi:methylenetetrahydrofolate dehydrogenase (NADP+)/methenyltetrahydrofolate cyclohydrolase